MKGVLIFILIVLVGIAGYLGYFVFMNISANPESFSAIYSKKNLVLVNSSVEQFYPNMRFKTGEISYSIGTECDSEKRDRMITALNYLENKTKVLKFYESSSGDIEVRCGKEYEKEGLFVAGEGGPNLIINGTLFNVILSGQILLLYSKPPCSSEQYNVELHELLHVLGFAHSPDSRNIMYKISECNQAVSEETITELVELYSIESLPDLYFKDVFAVKKGGYLNLNFSIFNQGLEDSSNIRVELETEGKSEQVYNFTEIGISEGRLFWVENMKIPYNTKIANLTIVNGKELDYSNNIVTLTLA